MLDDISSNSSRNCFADFCNFCSQRYNFSGLQHQVVLHERKTFDYSNNANSLATELDRVKTSKDMKEFLVKYVDWNVEFYSTDDFEISESQTNSNKSFSSIFCKADDFKSNNFKNILQAYYIIFVVLGLISLFGNGVAIIHHARNFFTRKSTKTKESKVYDILVFNLCFADLLNAVYLIVYPIVVANLKTISDTLCKTLGVISLLSIQSSVSFLVIITIYRLYCVLYPYKSVHIKKVVLLIVLVWLVWLVVVSLPLFNVSHFAHAFTYGIEIIDDHCEIILGRITVFVDLLVTSLNDTQEPFGLVLNKLKDFSRNNEVVVQISNSFNLIDHGETRFYEYFKHNKGCSIEIGSPAGIASDLFSLSLLMFNLVAFIFIIIAYIIIFQNLSSFGLKSIVPRALQKQRFKHKEQKTQKIKSENKQIYLRILVIVITDMICGIPICLFGLVTFIENATNSCYWSKNFIDTIAPLLSFIILPLNSVINPYIYSFHLRKKFFEFCKRPVQSFFSSSS